VVYRPASVSVSIKPNLPEYARATLLHVPGLEALFNRNHFEKTLIPKGVSGTIR